MSSGIYILHTKDGYRVNFSDQYYSFFGSFVDSTFNYEANAKAIDEAFGLCSLYKDKDQALLRASMISKNLEYETFDGIMFIENFKDKTFEELING
jgi:hypothetical protein